MKLPTHEVLQHLIVRLRAHDSAITFMMIKDNQARGGEEETQYSRLLMDAERLQPEERFWKKNVLEVRGQSVEGRGQRAETTMGK